MPNKEKQARRERDRQRREGVETATETDAHVQQERPAVAPTPIPRCDFRKRDCYIRNVRNGWIVTYNGDEFTFNTTVDMLMFVATAFDIDVGQN